MADTRNTPTTPKSAQIIQLPTAAAEAVHQHPRRGRYPSIVTKIRRGYLLKLDAGADARIMAARACSEVQREVADAQNYYLVCKRIHDSALNELRGAQQRASKNGGAT